MLKLNIIEMNQKKKKKKIHKMIKKHIKILEA